MRLPAGSVSRIWRPPGPEITSLRNDESRGAQSVDLGVQVVDDQMDAVASGGGGVLGGGAGARAGRPGQQQPQRAAHHVGEGRRGAGVQGEAEMGGVEVDGRLDVVDEVADAGVPVGCRHG